MIRRIVSVITLSFVLSNMVHASIIDTINIAITDLEGAGFKPNEIIMISDKLRSSIIELSHYHIIEPSVSRIEAVTIHRFGAVFDDSVSQQSVPGTPFLSNNYTLSGRISRANSITALSVRIVDTKTDEIVFAKTKEYEVRFKELVSIKIPEFSRKLVSGIDSTLDFLTMQKEKGILFVESVPENGIIQFDGIETSFRTPATIKGIDEGHHSVSVNSGNKIGTSNVKVISGKLQKTVVKLEDGVGSLRILSTEPGLSVTIDVLGEYTTPVQLDSIPTGIYTIKSINDGYFSSYDTVNVVCQKTTEINLTPEKISYIQIDGVTDDSRVYLDKVPLNISFTNLYMVTPGEHVLSIERDGFFSRNFRLKALPSDTTRHTVRYAPHPAALSIQSAPEYASIMLNGRDIGKTPCILPSIIPGSYNLQLSHPSYEPIEINLNLIPGAKMEITESFKDFSDNYLLWKKKKEIASYTNLAFAGTGEIILDHDLPGIVLFSVGIFSDLAILGTSSQLYLHRRDYRNASTISEKNNYNRKIKKDYIRVTSSIISSVLLRGASFTLTHFKKY